MKKLLLLSALLTLSIVGMAQQVPPKSKTNSKLHSSLQTFKNNASLVPPSPVTINGFTMQAPEILINSDGTKVLVHLITKTNLEQLVTELEANGIKVESAAAGSASAYVAPGELGKLEQIANLQYAAPTYKPKNNLSGVIGQGDAALKADIARTTFGVNGTGVKVGVLSDSYNRLPGNPAAAGVTAGELPGATNPDGFLTPVEIIQDGPVSNIIDEGRAMVEIVHDVAPGATKAFATAFVGGQTGFANNIIALKDAGCNVIVDDIIYFAEPMFQDGIVAQAVNTVKAAGVTYFSSMGNQSTESFEVAYRPGTVTLPAFGTPITAHNFAAPGDPDRYLIPISIVGGASFTFQWNNPFKSVSPASTGATSDLDLHFFANANGTVYLGSAVAFNVGADGVEINGFNGTGTLYMAIERFDVGANAEPGSGADPTLLKMVMFGNTYVPFPAQSPALAGNYAAPAGFGHANAAGALGIGAVPFNQTPAFGVTPPVIEPFSSRGGVPILFDLAGNPLGAPEIRNKPELSAPDGANNSFFGGNSSIDGPDGIPNFFGTSAAAPYAAAVAALMIQSRNGNAFTPDQLKTVMLNSCIDMDDPDLPGFQPGFDYRTGNGLLQADAAIAQANCITPTFTFTETSGLTNNDGTICAGATITITASGGGTYLWNTTETTASITVSPGMTTTYTVAVNGCSPNATPVVTVKPIPTSALTASKVDVCPNNEVTLDAHCSIPTATVNWNPGAPTVTPAAATIPYIYKASCTADGCLGNESSVEVRTHRILVDMKDLDVGTLPKAIVGAVKDNMAPTNLITATASPRRWTFIANGCSASESAVFKLSGPVNFMAIDNAATYALFANDASGFYSIDHPNYGNGGSFPNGTYTLTVDLRSADGMGGPFPKNRVVTGSLLATRTLQFTVGNPSARIGAGEFLVSDSPVMEPFARVSPNPISNILHLQVSGAAMQKVNVHLLDASGRSLLQRDFTPQSNQHREEFEVSHLTHGMYFIRVNTDQNRATLKVIKIQ